MEMQTKARLGNNWSCTALSFAMAFDVQVEQIISWLGHDGSGIVDPFVADPRGRQGFHAQECVFFGLACGKSCTPFEVVPVSAVGESLVNLGTDKRLDFANYLLTSGRGVITGKVRQNYHAIAFDHGDVFDSAGSEHSDTSIQTLVNHHHFIPTTIWMVR
jgi:hypothetical protein